MINFTIENNSIENTANFSYGSGVQAERANISNNALLGYLNSVTDCMVTNNELLTGQASADMMTVFGVSTITGNKFIRNSVSVNSYVYLDSAAKSMVTNNSFDDYTTNGSNETVVANFTVGNIVDQNKNQMHYLSVLPTDGSCGTSSPTTETVVQGPYNNSGNSTLYVVRAFLSTPAATAARSVVYQVNLSRMIPKFSRVMAAGVGFAWITTSNNINATTGNNTQILLDIFQTDPTKPLTNSYATPSTTLMDLSPFFSPLTGGSTAYQMSATITNSTAGVAAYINNTNFATGTFVSNDQNDLICTITVFYNTTATAGTANYILSPLLVKYILQ